MDMSLSQEQVQLVDAVRRTVERCAAASPLAVRGLDRPVLSALEVGGLLDVVAGGGSLLDAVLVVDAAARAAVCVPVAARVLVAPGLLGGTGSDVVGLADRPSGGLVRFGAEADEVLLVDGERARRVAASDLSTQDGDLPRGYPMARLLASGGEDLGPGSGERLLRLWRTGLAAEAGGLMAGAVLLAAGHVKDRRQFGRPIGAYQAVQHRLALAHVATEGVRWLARWAAWHPDSDELAAAAATQAQTAARDVVRHLHQVAGAIGITVEFGLTRYTGKLSVLSVELGGASVSARALAQARWRSGASRRPAPGHRGRGIAPDSLTVTAPVRA